MQQTRFSVSPRGWAMLTLVGGATLASPFLRPPQVDVDDVVSESPLAHGSVPSRLVSQEVSLGWPSDITTAPAGSLPFDSSSLSPHIAPPSASSPAALPAWARTRSPIDQVISQGAAPPWNAPASSGSSIQPLETWVKPLSDNLPPRDVAAIASTTAGRWPEMNTLPAKPEVKLSTSPNRSPGSLVGSAPSGLPSTPTLMRPQSGPSLTPPTTQPKFVFQPGFHPNLVPKSNVAGAFQTTQ